MTVDITRAKAIEGFMWESELVWLAERAAEHRYIVEIGSFLGRSTRAMLDNTKGIVYALDDWFGPRDKFYEKEERDQFYLQFVANINDKRSHLRIIRGNYEKNLGGQIRPSMVFIDGSHEYLDVLRDIERWIKRITPGGLICGHDINQPDVIAAVKCAIGDYEVAPNTTIWYKKC